MTQLLTVQDLSVTFPNGNGGLHALSRLNFGLDEQEFLCMLGPSGSGKSTILRVIAGLVEPTTGGLVYGTDGGQKPRIGVVFQQANLMPWRSVIENIMLPLELSGVDRDIAENQAQELIHLVGLEGFEDTWPRDLSGGMAQRVAIARALIHDPDILLLDEPFGALDALTREKMGAELMRIWHARQKTVLMVTHSISEAVYLADRVLVLTSRPGKICLNEKVDLPRPRREEMRYSTQFAELSKMIKQAVFETEKSVQIAT